jgi:hypothetical protein
MFQQRFSALTPVFLLFADSKFNVLSYTESYSKSSIILNKKSAVVPVCDRKLNPKLCNIEQDKSRNGHIATIGSLRKRFHVLKMNDNSKGDNNSSSNNLHQCVMFGFLVVSAFPKNVLNGTT